MFHFISLQVKRCFVVLKRNTILRIHIYHNSLIKLFDRDATHFINESNNYFVGLFYLVKL